MKFFSLNIQIFCISKGTSIYAWLFMMSTKYEYIILFVRFFFLPSKEFDFVVSFYSNFACHSKNVLARSWQVGIFVNFSVMLVFWENRFFLCIKIGACFKRMKIGLCYLKYQLARNVTLEISLWCLTFLLAAFSTTRHFF